MTEKGINTVNIPYISPFKERIRDYMEWLFKEKKKELGIKKWSLIDALAKGDQFGTAKEIGWRSNKIHMFIIGVKAKSQNELESAYHYITGGIDALVVIKGRWSFQYEKTAYRRLKSESGYKDLNKFPCDIRYLLDVDIERKAPNDFIDALDDEILEDYPELKWMTKF